MNNRPRLPAGRESAGEYDDGNGQQVQADYAANKVNQFFAHAGMMAQYLNYHRA